MKKITIEDSRRKCPDCGCNRFTIELSDGDSVEEIIIRLDTCTLRCTKCKKEYQNGERET